MEKINLLNINFSISNLEKILNEVIELLKENNKFYICFPNAYLTVVANEQKKLLDILNSAKFVLPDGMPLIWYSKTFKKSLYSRISGYDFFYNFSKVANEEGYTYFFLGGESKEVVLKIIERLNKDFKNIKVKGFFVPPFSESFSEEINNKIIEKINGCKPDILWVGLSAPKQEIWIYENLGRLNIKMACGIGAVFNFYSGQIKRAPIWMQKVGLEWLYRLCSEPKRLFKKYLIYNTKFVILILRDLVKRFCSIYKKKFNKNSISTLSS